ncbi:hypothetical protein [Enhygromyxa salina]|uniref:hypothetical protein n=1 Tax=Enhygromyxa salina TaxID=215803 RepID=UPI0013FCF780|nr:hypothetical protein [Enhygromyxa salina]
MSAAAIDKTTLIKVESSVEGEQVQVEGKHVIIVGDMPGGMPEWTTTSPLPPLAASDNGRADVSGIKLFRAALGENEAKSAAIASDDSRINFDKCVIVGLDGAGVRADGDARVTLWSTTVLGAHAGLEALSDGAIEAVFVSVGALSGAARQCADGGRVDVHKSILYSAKATPDECDSSSISDVWDMNAISPNPNKWFANFIGGDLHVGEGDMGPHAPSSYYNALPDGPRCDLDGDEIPLMNAYPGADQPL